MLASRVQWLSMKKATEPLNGSEAEKTFRLGRQLMLVCCCLQAAAARLKHTVDTPASRNAAVQQASKQLPQTARQRARQGLR